MIAACKRFLHFSVYCSLFAAFLTGCCDRRDSEYVKREGMHSEFVFGLESYLSTNETKAILAVHDDQWVIWDDSPSPTRPGVPPCNILTIQISDQQFAEHRGDLYLSFLNDRLMSLHFYPSADVNEFVQRLGFDHAVLRSSQGALRDPYTRVWISEDYKNKFYVGWEDTRLADQLSGWFRCYD